MRVVLKNIFSYFAENPEIMQHPWLILGKGPSFSMRCDYDLSPYKILTLNDSARQCSKIDIAHFIDFDAYERCSHALSESDGSIVVMPWFPHFNHKAGTADLASLLNENPLLSQLAGEGRLYWYDLTSSPVRHGRHPVVSARFFSAEAAFDLLATAGVKRVRSLGVDGGKTYSEEFSDLSIISLLANSQKNFNRQFESFAKVIARTGADYAPLGMETPIRIYVASSASEALPVKVLEYSIRQHASTTVTVTPLCDVGISIPKPRAPENQPRTPFSFQRFLIPQVCGYAGHAIYLDSDMMVFKDITDLWRRPLGDANVLAAYSASASGRKPQYSVMLMDCSQLRWNIREIVDQLDAGTLSYEQLMYELSLARPRADIEPDWNSLEAYKEGQTALLHFTDMSTQPWVSHLNPLGYLWVRSLRQAVRDGAIPRALVEDEVRLGHVRPSLLYQLDHEIDDAILLPKVALAADAGFTPPYRTLGVHQASPWRSRLQWLRASMRAKYQTTLLYRLERRVLNRLKMQFDR
jgi:hypothetical protein